MRSRPEDILLVQYNRSDTQVMLQMFNEMDADYELTTASTLSEGIDLMEQQVFGTILVDLFLPDSTGVETVVKLKEHTNHTPIIALTGSNSHAIGKQATEVGAQDYLVKDEIDANILACFIRYAFAKSQVEQANQELVALHEQQRIAREMHDSLTQTLFAAQVIAESSLAQWENDSQRSYELMEQVHLLTRGALAEMRVLLLELRPNMLNTFHLNYLIEQLIAGGLAQRNIDFTAEMDTVPIIKPRTTVALYRIVQEALGNIIKHSHTKHVFIRLKMENDTIHIRIQDDGVGFNVGAIRENDLGIRIMEEYAAEIGTVLHIKSDLGFGTVVTLTLKLKQEEILTS